MKRLTLLILSGLWIAMPLSSAQARKPGIYAVSGKNKIGRRLSPKLTKVELIAHDNLNTAFHLTLHTGWTAKPLAPLALVVAGNTFISGSHGSTENRSRSYSFSQLPATVVRQIARLFRTKPKYRKHPGYLIATSFATDKGKYKLGEPIRARVTIVNLGSKPLSVMVGGRNRGHRDNQFNFAATRNGKPIIDSGSPMHFGGLAAAQTIAPQKSFTKTVDLRKWYKLSKPGGYSVTGTWAFDVVKPGGFDVIWNDIAAGEFYFRIEK